MILEKIEWICLKQADIINQIRTVKERIESGKSIQVLGGVPEDITPQELINFHKDRYSILEIAKNYSPERIQKWLSEAKSREDTFQTRAEIALLEQLI